MNRISLKVEKKKKNNLRRASVEHCQIVAVYLLCEIHLPLHQSAMISTWVLIEIDTGGVISTESRNVYIV